MKFHGLVSENMCEDFLPENGRLQLHFWYNSLNFEASLIFAKLCNTIGIAAVNTLLFLTIHNNF